MIDLVVFNINSQNFIWSLGEIFAIAYDFKSVSDILDEQKNKSGGTFFWDCSYGLPDQELVAYLYETKVDIFHSGNFLKTNEYLKLYHFINPCWMLSAKPSPNVNCVSWFFTFKCSLVKNEVIRQLNGIDQDFTSIEYAALDFGYRSIKSGLIIKSESMLVDSNKIPTPDRNCLEDFIFTRKHFKNNWVKWAAYRAIRKNVYSKKETVNVYIKSKNIYNKNYEYAKRNVVELQLKSVNLNYTVSAVIITLGRYDYIEKVIVQLLNQTVPLHEIIVIDGNPVHQRDQKWLQSLPESDTSVRLVFSEITGQCTQRNIGIAQATGKYILFMDDDMDNIPTDHLEKHLQTINYFGANVSCGIPDEVGLAPAKRHNNVFYVSDVFPTNDVVVEKESLLDAGLFDTKMDKGQSEDLDIGMRIYLKGGLMITNPALKTLHLRAGSGGLRTHGNRKITYGSSRKKILHKRLLHTTEIYLCLKYFPIDEVKERIFLNAMSTFSIHSGILKKTGKILFAATTFRNTLKELKKRLLIAKALLKMTV